MKTPTGVLIIVAVLYGLTIIGQILCLHWVSYKKMLFWFAREVGVICEELFEKQANNVRFLHHSFKSGQQKILFELLVCVILFFYTFLPSVSVETKHWSY